MKLALKRKTKSFHERNISRMARNIKKKEKSLNKNCADHQCAFRTKGSRKREIWKTLFNARQRATSASFNSARDNLFFNFETRTKHARVHVYVYFLQQGTIERGKSLGGGWRRSSRFRMCERERCAPRRCHGIGIGEGK